jgi:predicted RNA binding protein YcfA (HicA-like mRNA interferase family)
MGNLPGELDGRRFLRALAKFGWRLETQRGSHRKLIHESRATFLIIAFHSTVSRITIRKTLRQAGIDEEEFLQEI